MTGYSYCSADPVNCVDLDGHWGWKKLFSKVAAVASIASMIPGPIGTIAGVVSAGAYLAAGNRTEALWAIGGAAAALIGAGAVVKGARIAAGAVKAARAVAKAARVTAKVASRAGKAINKGGRLAARGASRVGKATVHALTRAKHAVTKLARTVARKLVNGNNFLRIGKPKPGAKFRISIGPVMSYYKKMGPIKLFFMFPYSHGENLWRHRHELVRQDSRQEAAGRELDMVGVGL